MNCDFCDKNVVSNDPTSKDRLSHRHVLTSFICEFAGWGNEPMAICRSCKQHLRSVLEEWKIRMAPANSSVEEHGQR